MKKINLLKWSLLVAVPLTLVLAGCNKLLDRKPLQATIDDLNQGKLEGRILGMYSNLRDMAGFSTLPWLDFHSIRDDDAQKGSDANDGKEVVTEFDTYQYTKDDWAPNSYWEDHFAIINSANTAIFEAIEGKVTDEPSLRNLGEALFFRGYAYFDLVKTYGEVPLFNGPILEAQDGIKPKAPVADIYALIDSSLTAAAELLPIDAAAYGTGYTGRLTSGAATTMLAQSKLFQKDWASVIALCNTVISSGKYSLVEHFPDIFKEGTAGEGKNGPESIFEMQSWTGQGAASNDANYHGSFWGTTQQIRQNGAPVEWNLGWGWNTPTQDLVDAYEPGDPRKAATVLFSGQSDDPDNGGYGRVVPPYTNALYWNKKVYADPNEQAIVGDLHGAAYINYRALRYADVVLMAAEAANEIGDGAKAATYLEMIRARARNGDDAVLPPIAFADQTQMRTAIQHERRVEFGVEQERFYDLVRWGLAETTLAPLGYLPKHKYFPIPQNAITAANGKLTQNPDY